MPDQVGHDDKVVVVGSCLVLMLESVTPFDVIPVKTEIAYLSSL